jgi:DNA N-6-adenine-methyltransferase (Dam)
MPFTPDGFKERSNRHKGKPAFPVSDKPDWSTPPQLFADLDAEFHFDYDPCPLKAADDGLLPLFSEWAGRRIFINCPYGPAIAKWLQRAHEADLAVFLLPSRTDTVWFHTLCLPHAKEIRFLKGRLKFGGAKTGAPFPSMIVVFEKSADPPKNSETFGKLLGWRDALVEEAMETRVIPKPAGHKTCCSSCGHWHDGPPCPGGIPARPYEDKG